VTPGKFDLAIYRGDTYRYRFTLWADADHTQPEDLTGATVKSELRDKPGGVVIGEMALTVTLPNIIEGVLTPALTTAIGTKGGVWDLQLTYFGTDVYTVLAGAVFLTPDVTDSGGLSNAARRRIQ
jgi:hypothetical protein